MRAALLAPLLLLGPCAVAASADTVSVSGPTAQRVLVLTGTGVPGNSTVTVSSATLLAGKTYRFTSTTPIDITGPTAKLLCDPDPSGAAVECADDATPTIPDDDIAELRVDAGDGADNVTILDEFSTARVTVNGGPGADTLTGGAGAERLVGDAGADTISAGGGNDTIEARDGMADNLSCGVGAADTVFADSIDTVDADCENRTIVTPPVPPPPVPPPPVPAPRPAPPPVVVTPPFPVAIGVSAAFEALSRGTRVRRLTVKDVPADSFVHVVCTSPSRLAGGARCPFTRARISVTKKTSKLALVRRFRNRRLAPHTIIRLYGVAVGRVGTYVRFTLRTHGSPARSDGCANARLRRISCLSTNPD